MNWPLFWLVPVLIVGFMRLGVEPGIDRADIYKDLAHVLVGGLFGAGFRAGGKPYLWMAIGLTVLEIVCAVGGKLLS